MAGIYRAFLDASVLYPASLRNLLMRLTLRDLFQARWSRQVHDEWIRSVLRDRPDISAWQLHRVRDAMDRHAEDCLVTGYEGLVSTLILPDPDDRHVLAAAIIAGADVIVTRNLRDFPVEVLVPFGIEAQHPDIFVRHLIDLEPVKVIDAIREQVASLIRPPVTVTELLTTFEKLGLADTDTELRRQMQS
jgi:predicted nucleic acid-binding protein